MKGTSEARVRAALSSIDDPRVMVYKMPDDSRNWKPADFAVWFRSIIWRAGLAAPSPQSAFIEVKQCDAVAAFPLREVRSSQWRGIREAGEAGVPYFIVIWWSHSARWTITHAALLEKWWDKELDHVPYAWLSSVAGIDCTQSELATMLRSVLLGETD